MPDLRAGQGKAPSVRGSLFCAGAAQYSTVYAAITGKDRSFLPLLPVRDSAGQSVRIATSGRI